MITELKEKLSLALSTEPMVRAVDLWTVAQTIWGEARGEEENGRLAVGYVILNRSRVHLRWLGQPLVQICKAKAQFSCWNLDDPNYPQLATLTFYTELFAECLYTALDCLTGSVLSPVRLATHYFNKNISDPPKWAKDKDGRLKTPVAVIGNHVFFENIP